MLNGISRSFNVITVQVKRNEGVNSSHLLADTDKRPWLAAAAVCSRLLDCQPLFFLHGPKRSIACGEFRNVATALCIGRCADKH